jgi:hypothetical protein
MICVKTFKEISTKDFDTWQEWLNFVEENARYCREESTINDYKGKCEPNALPSEHPYWRKIVRDKSYETMLKHISNLEECSKDPNKIKYLYNMNTTLETIRNKINRCRSLVETYDKTLIE